jgi:hypothetical protein
MDIFTYHIWLCITRAVEEELLNNKGQITHHTLLNANNIESVSYPTELYM